MTMQVGCVLAYGFATYIHLLVSVFI